MHKPVLKFRADAGQQIGWGHIMRCISVAQMTSTEFSIHFYCLEIPYVIGKELQEMGFELHQINQEDEFLDGLENTDLVILDGYTFNEKYQRKIKSARCKLILIDDLITGFQVADIVINHAPGVEISDYKGEEYTQYLLGTDYALVRQVFLNTKSNPTIENTLLICFGGSDPKNITLKSLDIAVKLSCFKQIHVITGGSYAFLESITDFKHPNVLHHHGLAAVEMANVMSKCSHAIVPSSGVLYECLVNGLICASGYYAENQIPTYQGFLRSGSIVDAFDFSTDSIVEAINQLSNLSRGNSTSEIDNKSGARILNAALALYNKLD